MFTVYVLHFKKYDKIYIGYTTNLSERLKSHNELGTKGWAIKYRPWFLIHTVEFDAKKLAMAREHQLKSGQGRLWIRKALLNSWLVGLLSA